MPNARPHALAALGELAGLSVQGLTNVALLYRRDDAELQPYRLDATRALTIEFRRAAIDFGKAMQNGRLVAYDPGRMPDENEIACLERTKVAGLESLVARLEAPAEMSVATGGLLDEHWPQGYVVSVASGMPRAWYHFFRRMTSASRLKRSGKIAVLAKDKTFDRLEVDPMLFDPLFDAIDSKAEILIVRQRNFESLFSFLEKAAAAVRTTLTRATSSLRISNLNDLLAASSSDPNMIAKVRGVERKLVSQPDYAARMTMANIRRLKQNYPDLPFSLEGPRGRETLTYRNDPQHRWEILKLLDDDYVQSLLTEIMYEANSKTPL